MMRTLAAFAWLRWRLTVGAFRRHGGRDLLTSAARIGEVLGPIVLALLVLPAAFALGLLGAFGGWDTARSPEHRNAIIVAARALLAALTLMVFIGQLVRAMTGVRSDPARFALLPVRRWLLYVSSVAAGLADPWLGAVLPGLFLYCAALAAGGAVFAGGAALTASLLLVAILLLIGACLECALQLLFRDRRRGEWVTLLATTALAFLGFLPLLLDGAWDSSKTARPDPAPALRAAGILPSELWGKAVRSALDADPAAVAAALTGLLVSGAALALISWRLYARLLASPAVSSARAGQRGAARAWPRLPGLSDAASAVAWAQLRLIVRSVSGKSLLFVGPFAFALLVVVAPRMFQQGDSVAFVADPRMLAAFAAVFFSLVSLAKVSANQFALDGPGLTLQFLLPISDRDLVKGKSAGIGIVWLLSLAVYLLLALPFVPGGSPWSVPAAIAAGLAAYLAFAPVAAMLAAMLPKPADLSKLGSGGKPHPIAGVVATFLASGLFAIPALLSVHDFRAGPSARGFAGATLCAALAGGLSFPLTRLASDVLARRREAIVLAAKDR